MNRRVGLALIACVAVGCAKRASSETASAPQEAPSMDDPGADAAEHDEDDEARAPGRSFAASSGLDALQAEFDSLDADLSAQGILRAGEVTPEPEAAGTKKDEAKDGGVARCERICDLEQAICDVSERICALADEPAHAGDDAYVQACTRADARCEQATEACEACR